MRIKKPCPFNNYEFDYEESWLNGLAHDGLLLSKEGRFSYEFEKSDNHCRRYRIIPKKHEEFSDEELQLFQDSGWHMLLESDDKTYFYSDDPDAPDLFTDEESYRNYLKKNLRRYRNNIIWSILIVAVWGANLFLRMPGNQQFITELANNSLLSEISYLALILFLIEANASQGIGMLKCRRRILNGEKAECTEAFYIRKKAELILGGIIVAFALVALVITFTGSGRVRGDKVFSYNEPSPVLFREFSPEEWDFVKDNRQSFSWDDDKGVKYDYYLYNSSNLTLRKGYSENIYYAEAMNYSDWELPAYTSLTYDFRSANTAEKMLRRQICNDMDLDRNDPGKEDKIHEISIDIPGTDYAGYYEKRDGGSDLQYLYLRKGSKVVYAYYSGKMKLMDKLQLFIDQLEAGENL